VRLRVCAHGVCSWHKEVTHSLEVPSLFPIQPNVPRLRGNIQLLQSRIEGQNVGIIPHRIGAQYFHVRKIDQGQRVIACARDECEAILRIERDAMRLL
jgi:hypothetical protein